MERPYGLGYRLLSVLGTACSDGECKPLIGGVERVAVQAVVVRVHPNFGRLFADRPAAVSAGKFVVAQWVSLSVVECGGYVS